jgi:hypothetical protein
MDIIVIGRETYRAKEASVIYVGPLRSEAAKAVAATGGRFQWIYEIDSRPIRNYKSTEMGAAEVAPEPIAEAPKAETQSTKKKNSK